MPFYSKGDKSLPFVQWLSNFYPQVSSAIRKKWEKGFNQKMLNPPVKLYFGDPKAVEKYTFDPSTFPVYNPQPDDLVSDSDDLTVSSQSASSSSSSSGSATSATTATTTSTSASGRGYFKHHLEFDLVFLVFFFIFIKFVKHIVFVSKYVVVFVKQLGFFKLRFQFHIFHKFVRQ